MREQAFLNPGIRIIMRDERDLPQNNGKVREDILHYEGGIVSFVEYLNRNKHCNVINPDIIYMKAQKEFRIAEVAFQYTDKSDETIMSFATNIIPPEGGTGSCPVINRVWKTLFPVYGVEKVFLRLPLEGCEAGAW